MEIVLILWIMFAITCGVIASSKGRNSLGWAALGALAGIFALVAVCAMPSLNKDR